MPLNPPAPTKSIEQVVHELGLYPMDAFEFVQQGLQYAAHKAHGEIKQAKGPRKSRHVTGQQLCEGLREFALLRWGLLARTVLRRWNINRTDDFGRIVFALVANGFLSKTEEDTLADFRNVYDFESAFEAGYQIGCKA